MKGNAMRCSRVRKEERVGEGSRRRTDGDEEGTAGEASEKRAGEGQGEEPEKQQDREAGDEAVDVATEGTEGGAG